ncbi:MAG TPA: hypothetical protein VFK41_01320 [Nocardioidaceae bacterium]|nr:hypothetical protein [Nocardioidaceae bacterium]
MSTALSSTETSRAKEGWFGEARRATADARALFAFRAGTLRGKSRRYAAIGVGTIVVITVLVSWLPAYLPEGDGRRLNVATLLPSALLGVLVISIVSAAATGGGRELLPRDQGVAFPVSATTDHLGALMMAPLNVAWLLQSWTLMGSVSYVVGPSWKIIPSELLVMLWLATGTSIAQVVAWGIEWLRRGPGGVWGVRALGAASTIGMAYLVADDKLVPLLDNSRVPLWIVQPILFDTPDLLPWVLRFAALPAAILVAVALGAMVAGAVAARQPRDELKLESAPYRPRATPRTELAALLRTDRVGIWRSVPLRRGLFVLGLMPGAVAVAGALEWSMLTILPGLVASGGALLFGVNSWCLDGRGALWRDSLPVAPKLVFVSRAVVLTEVLLFATLLTLVLASLRAGVPTASELVAVLVCALVVVLQVVSRSLRWSVSRPYAVDMRSARATPAPPLVMVGYSSRLALTTTLTGMLFAVTSRVGVDWTLILATPFLIFSAYRLVQTAAAWADPEIRCNVVSTVAS